jgi:hypothetical protein
MPTLILACFFVMTLTFTCDWRRTSPSSPTMIVEQQKQLLAWERELESHEGTIIAWEESLMAFAHVLGGGGVRLWNVTVVMPVWMPSGKTILSM